MVEHKVNCSFCGKSNTEVQRVLVADAKKAAICDECIIGCLEILIYGEPEDIIIALEDEVVESDVNAQKNCGC